MKRKGHRLSEVQIESSPNPLAAWGAADDGARAFTVRLPHGAAVRVPPGFDPDELFALLVVVQEALA